MRAKKSLGSMVFDGFNVAGMLLLNFIMVYPFVYIFSISISNSDAVGRGLVTFFPKGLDLSAYKTIFQTNDIIRSYGNTILYTLTATFIVLFADCLAAYPLSKADFYGRGVLSFVLSLTYILPTGMIASFLMIRNLKMLDSMWALVIPPAFNFWYIVLIRTSFQSLPASLSESAKLDGAGEWRILLQIVLPLSKATLATIALFAAVSQWNSYFHPLLYLNDPAKYPLQMLLRKIVVANDVNSTGYQEAILSGGAVGLGFSQKIQMATILASIGPIVLAYPYLQKYFVKGIMLGAVKG